MTVRETALALLNDYEASGKYSNLALKSHVADSATGKDRAFLAALFYTSVEHRLTYDYWISHFASRGINDVDAYTRNILRLGLCQLTEIKVVPDYASVNETVKLARNKGEAAFVNAILRSFLRAREQNALPMPDKKKNYARYLSVRESFSLDVVRALITELGEDETERLLVHFNTARSTDITVNTLKISVVAYLALLKEFGYTAERSTVSSVSVVINGSHDPRELPGYNEGYFFVQDSACSASAEVLGAKRGDTVVDVCSAPGGKSFATAILTGDGANISAFDIHESKLSLITDGAKRLGLNSISAQSRDARLPASELAGSADRVICDVPCSGLGVLGKKSDMRYKSADSFDALPQLQYEILKSASSYLKIGGRLVYSTCTLRREENEAVAERFIVENPGFALCDFNVGALSSSGGMITLNPHVHNTDGFFISLIERRK